MIFGEPRRHFTECTSTNDLAKAWACAAADPAPHGALVTADYQTRGRGRRGRTWTARAGQSVLMSLVLHTDLPLGEIWQLNIVAALSVISALDPIIDGARIKWPNDIVLPGGKVAGILVETFQAPVTGRQIAIAGIGVNINQDFFPESDTYVYPPVSVFMAAGRERDPNHIIAAIARGFDHWNRVPRGPGGIQQLMDACRARLAVGARVRRGDVTAELVDIDAGGRAKVRFNDGTFDMWESVDGEEG